MIMALLIGLLLRGGKFLTHAARRTLWQMFETNECGPKIILDNENLLKLTRTTETRHYTKNDTNNKEVSCAKRNYATVADNKKINDCNQLKQLENEVDGALNNIEKVAPKKHSSSANLDQLLDELERKVREIDANDPVVLPTFMPQKLAAKKKSQAGDNFAHLEGCISKFRIVEREFCEPVLPLNPRKRTKYLKSSISDNLYVKFGKSRKYFQRITEHFSSHTHNSLPNLTVPANMSFFACRSLHTKSGSDNFIARDSHNGVELGNGAIREMLDQKIKQLAEKKDRRKKRNVINTTEIKEREKLLEINEKTFKKVEDDLKTVKIINKNLTSRHQFIDVDELLLLLEDNPKFNFLRNYKIHKEMPHYEKSTSAEFIVHMKPDLSTQNQNVHIPFIEKARFTLPKTSEAKLDLAKLQNEIEASYKQTKSRVKTSMQFMAYEQIPRIYHEMNKDALENEINSKAMSLVKTTKTTLQINREWEKFNSIKLQEEITRNTPLKKFTLPSVHVEGKMEMDVERAEEVKQELFQSKPIEEQKRLFRKKMKARRIEETKSKESIKMLVRPVVVKRLGKKLSKVKRIEKVDVQNAETAIQTDLVLKEKNIKAAADFDGNLVKNDDGVEVKAEIKVDDGQNKERNVDVLEARSQTKISEEATKSERDVKRKVQEMQLEVAAIETLSKPQECTIEKENPSEILEASISADVEQKTSSSPTSPQPPPNATIQINVASSKVDLNHETPSTSTASNNAPMEIKVTKSKEALTVENESDFEKIKMDVIQNSLPESQMSKSRIPVRKATSECYEAMEAANKTIQKIAMDYQNQKSGRVTLIPGVAYHNKRNKLRPLQKKMHNKEFRPCIKEEVEEDGDSVVGQTISDNSVVKRSESDVLKKLLNKRSAELKVEGRSTSDLGIENEMPPDFDVLQEVDLVDNIPMEDEGLELPAEQKQAMMHSEKNVEEEKYCSDPTKEKELVALLLDSQNVEELKEKQDANLNSCSPSDEQQNNKSEAYEMSENSEQKQPEQSTEDEKTEDWDLNAAKEYPVQQMCLNKTNKSLANDAERKPSSSSEQQNEGKHKNLLNNVPVNMRKTQSFATMPKYTFWNRQPKTNVNPDAEKSKEKDGESKKKQEGGVEQKKYKMVTDEIDKIGGGKMKVTKLVEDV